MSYPFDEHRKEGFREHIDDISQHAACASQQTEDDSRGSDVPEASLHAAQRQRPVYVVCRRGNDSQHVVQMLRQTGIERARDLVGGLEAWSREENVVFPEY